MNSNQSIFQRVALRNSNFSFSNQKFNIPKIFYSPKSRKDLDRIYDYIYDDLNNPIAAEKTVKGILNKIGEIKEYPRLGSVWYLENNIDSGF